MTIRLMGSPLSSCRSRIALVPIRGLGMLLERKIPIGNRSFIKRVSSLRESNLVIRNISKIKINTKTHKILFQNLICNLNYSNKKLRL